MNIRGLFSAVALAVMSTGAAHAAHINFDGNIADDDVVDIFSGPFRFNASFIADDPGNAPDDFTFTFTNSSSRAADVSAFSTINQGGAGFGFAGGVVTTFGTALPQMTAQGMLDAFTMNTRILPGTSAVLRFAYGDEYGTGSGANFIGPDIDFRVFAATPVPVPAAGFLLAAGLGGLAMVRRRKTAA